MKRALAILVLVVFVSGCSQMVVDEESALEGEVSEPTITDDSPGEITINARNPGNETRSYYVILNPVGDYSEIVEVSDRDDNLVEGISLGEAVPGASTGERFATVEKRLNVTSTVKIRATLYEEETADEVASRIFTLRTVEE